MLHLYFTFILRLLEAMSPLQVPKNFKFELFFNDELDATSDLFSHVASNVQVASISIISLSSSSNPKSKRNGKEHVEFVKPLKKKPRIFYEKTCVFQDTWAYCFPWAKAIVGEDGLVAQVWCKICNNIERRPKLLAFKLDTLQKHVGCHKATIFSFDIVIEDYLYCKDATHAKNERTYSIQNLEFVMTLVQSRIHLGVQKKFIQFVTILHILLHVRPMLEYDSLRELFLLLKVKNTPLKHSLRQKLTPMTMTNMTNDHF